MEKETPIVRSTTNTVLYKLRYVYKYRSSNGIAKYEILNGVFGVDDTLHLRDTTCEHYGDNCEIEVVKSELGDYYQFSKALNANAEQYIYFHQLEKFWATKEEAYVEGMERDIESCYQSLADIEKRIVVDEEKLAGMKKEKVQYFTSEMVKSDNLCYVENEGFCCIIGTILFDDGKIGYLTDSNYTGGYDDNEGDRIILIEDKSTDRIMTENGESVYVSEQDYKNNKHNKAMETFTKTIENKRKNIENYTLKIERLNTIIGQKDILTIDEMRGIRNGH
jgi:hypothetical protein